MAAAFDGNEFALRSALADCVAHRRGLIVRNPIRGDDAVGFRAAEIAAANGYNAIAVTQLLPELAEPISRSSRVIFIDCDVRLSPGRIWITQPDSTQSFHGATSPSGLLDLAQDLYGRRPDALAIGVGPESLNLSESLSASVAAVLPQILRTMEQV